MMQSGAGETRSFTARLPADEYELLRSVAFYSGTTMSDLLAKGVRMLLAEYTRNAELDTMLEQSRVRFRETIDRLADSTPE